MMKKLLSLMTMLLVGMSVFAQKGLPQEALQKFGQVSGQVKMKQAQNPLLRSARRAPGVNRVRRAEGSVVTVPANAVIEPWHLDGANSAFVVYYYEENGWYDITEYTSALEVAVDGNDIYVRGLSYWFYESWVKGTLNGNVVTFPAMTLQGEDEYGADYIAGSTVCEFTCTYDADAKTLTLDKGYYILETGDDVADGYFSFWDGLALKSVDPVTPPASLTTGEYQLTAQSALYDSDLDEYVYDPIELPLTIGFDGDDVYIQGLAKDYYMAEAWVKGVRNADQTITIPSGQYLGVVFDNYYLYLVGTRDGQTSDITFTLGADGKTLSTTNWLIISANISLAAPYAIYTDATIRQIEAVAAKPAKPVIYSFADSDFGYYTRARIHPADIDGNAILRSNLSFRILYDVKGDIQNYTLKADDYDYLSEDMTTIPYGFDDQWDIWYDADYDDYMIYLNSADGDSWSRIGMQSVYEVGGEAIVSDICWYDVRAISTMPGTLLNGKKLATYYNSLEDVTLPDGVDIYTATLSDNGQSVVLHQAEGNVIPANNAVVLATADDVIYNYTVAETEVYTVLNSDNALYGTDLSWSSFYDTVLMLGSEDGTTAFYEREYPYMGSNTAYLPALGIPVVTIQTDDSGTASVASLHVTTDAVSTPVYNLSGQRVGSSYKGLTIQNGKKVLRK